jgi:hypothetical protein
MTSSSVKFYVVLPEAKPTQFGAPVARGPNRNGRILDGRLVPPVHQCATTATEALFRATAEGERGGELVVEFEKIAADTGVAVFGAALGVREQVMMET